MFDNEKEDDDLFLNDIGSLSQIYDSKKRFPKNFSPGYKKRNPTKSGSFAVADKKKNARTSEKHPSRDFAKDDKSHSSHSRFITSENIYDEQSVTLYDDEDVQVLSHTKAKENAYSDDRLYDEFELNVKASGISRMKDSPKIDAPWRMNRESKQAQDAKRLLEFEKTFKNDEIIGDDRYHDNFHKSDYLDKKEYRDREKNLSKKSFRKNIDFDKNYTQWAYDDTYDNEDKYEKDSPYDPERHYDENPQESFNREIYSNPENPHEELLDENYPNSEIPYMNNFEELKKDDLPKFNLFKIKECKSRNERTRNVVDVEKDCDEDVIILDDGGNKNPVRHTETGRIKISFNQESKLKPINELLFPDDSNSPGVPGVPIPGVSDVPLPGFLERTRSGQKIPVLSRPEGSNPLSTTPIPPVMTVPPTAPANSVQYPQNINNMSISQGQFSNSAYPLMGQNYMNSYNAFGASVMNESHPGNSFVRASAMFPNAAPQNSFPNFVGGSHPPMRWPTSMSNAPTSNKIVHKESANSEKLKNDDAVKEEIRRQNKNLMDQRNHYYQKYDSLKEELGKLKKQKKMLMDKKSHQAETFLKENEKLQNEIQNKIKAVKNVIDMFSKIIDKDSASKGPSDNSEESKRSSDERDDSKDKKTKRKYTRSRSKSRHLSRSRSRSRRTRTKSRSRSRSRSHSRSRRRSRSRSRSRSTSHSRHRRSRSRDKYYRRKRSHSKEKKSKKKEDKNSGKLPNADALMDKIERDQVKVDALKPQFDRFKPSFEEILVEQPVDIPKPPEIDVKRSRNLSINAIQTLPRTFTGELDTKSERINYVYYDPEIHWCRVCNVFPKTAKEYLLHLHAPEHKQVLTKKNLIDYPWHKNQPEPRKPLLDAPTERVPIQGLPFFVSATAWYCKLCNEWMGDLHCASAHLKSEPHEANYTIFLKTNPQWEEHWLDSRSKAYEAINQLKAAESITPAYSFETYVKPTTVPVPSLSSAHSDKKRSHSSSSSSSSSSYDGSEKKQKNPVQKNERKRSAEKKFKITLTEPKKYREMAKKPKVEIPEKFEPPAEPIKDKFVEEWNQPIRSKSKEREFLELKNKLKRKEALERNKAIQIRKRSMNLRKRSPERSRDDKRDDKRSESRKDDRKKYDSKSKEKTPEGPRLPEKFERITIERRTLGSKSSSKKNDKPPVKGRFPFIGKMPSKLSKKSELETSKSAIKASDDMEEMKNEDLPGSVQKQIEEYDKSAEETEDADIVVVDMDINEEEDEPVSIVIDDNISRKKDFDETLKILYPEEQPKASSAQSSHGEYSIQAGPVSASNLTQDYLVSLIKSTLVDKFKMPMENQNAQILEMASTMQQALSGVPTVADIPFPLSDPLNPPAHISAHEQLYDRPENQECEPEPIPPGTADIELTPKKKKNPISQKKRRHLKKIRQKLEEQEKLLQAKIEEQKNLGEAIEQTVESQSPQRPITSFDSDLLMLGIDEGDSAALLF